MNEQAVAALPELTPAFHSTFSSRLVAANGVKIHAGVGGAARRSCCMGLASDLVMLPHSGHFVPEEAPAEFSSAIAHFRAGD